MSAVQRVWLQITGQQPNSHTGSKSFVNMASTILGDCLLISCVILSDLVPQQAYFLPMHHEWKITFWLEEEAFDPDCSQCGDHCGSDDLPRLQVRTVWVDLPPALLQVQQQHLLIHLQGTLDTQTHECITHMLRLLWVHNRVSGCKTAFWWHKGSFASNNM